MSIVCFDGKVLAADSRRTLRRRNKTTGAVTYKHVTDEQVKIELFNECCKFRGETIEAVGRCGNLKISSLVIEDLRNNVDVESKYTAKRVAEFHKRASVLVLTANDAYHLCFIPGKGTEVTKLERKPFAMGSGKKEAMFLMDTFKLPACEAAMAVTLKYESCGGPIQVLKRDGWTGRLVKCDAKAVNVTGNERRLLVAKSIRTAADRMTRTANRRIEKKDKDAA